jgi:hypothetical protein
MDSRRRSERLSKTKRNKSAAVKIRAGTRTGAQLAADVQPTPQSTSRHWRGAATDNESVEMGRRVIARTTEFKLALFPSLPVGSERGSTMVTGRDGAQCCRDKDWEGNRTQKRAEDLNRVPPS